MTLVVLWEADLFCRYTQAIHCVSDVFQTNLTTHRIFTEDRISNTHEMLHVTPP